jgi:uncharacterized damage-inducible protein DinB
MNMPRTLMDDAFDHHTWATQLLVETCRGLTREQLAASVPGTYGSIVDTMRHLIGDGAFDLYVLTAGRVPVIDADAMSLAELDELAGRLGDEWTRFLAARPDPDAIQEEVDPDDGFRREASVGMRLAQALHHGSDHRSQICTALTTLGIKPPDISVWGFGLASGRTVEIDPPS